MTEADERWMAYIDAEVRAVCRERGWRHQIRRKWSVREKPVRESRLDDYEWKLITETFPGQDAQPTPAREAESEDCDFGVYFVLGFDREDFKFVLHHDTESCGDLGPHRDTASYTEIRAVSSWTLDAIRSGALRLDALERPEDVYREVVPPSGWLKSHLIRLTKKFEPNRFSLT